MAFLSQGVRRWRTVSMPQPRLPLSQRARRGTGRNHGAELLPQGMRRCDKGACADTKVEPKDSECASWGPCSGLIDRRSPTSMASAWSFMPIRVTTVAHFLASNLGRSTTPLCGQIQFCVIPPAPIGTHRSHGPLRRLFHLPNRAAWWPVRPQAQMTVNRRHTRGR